MMWDGDGGPMWGATGMGWAWLVTGLLGLALLVGVVAIAFLAGRAAARPAATATRPASEELLAQRFARGEIDEQEYRMRRDALAGTPGGSGRSLTGGGRQLARARSPDIP